MACKIQMLASDLLFWDFGSGEDNKNGVAQLLCTHILRENLYEIMLWHRRIARVFEMLELSLGYCRIIEWQDQKLKHLL